MTPNPDNRMSGEKNMSTEEQLADYMRGWVTAAKFGPIHESDSANGHFTQGWKDGRAAKDAAYRAACEYYGTKPRYVHPAQQFTDLLDGKDVQVGNMKFTGRATAFQKAIEAQDKRKKP